MSSSWSGSGNEGLVTSLLHVEEDEVLSGRASGVGKLDVLSVVVVVAAAVTTWVVGL